MVSLAGESKELGVDSMDSMEQWLFIQPSKYLRKGYYVSGTKPFITMKLDIDVQTSAWQQSGSG